MSDETNTAVHDEEDQMAAALAEMRSERTEPTPEPAQVVEVKDGPAVVAQATSTPSTDTAQEAAPEQPAKADQPADELSKAQAELHKLRSEMGRVNALNRLYNEARSKAEQLERENAELKTAKPSAASAGSVDSDTLTKLQAVADQVKDFPELAGLVAAVAESLTSVETKAAEVAKQAAAQAIQPLEGLRTEAEQRRAQEQAAAYQAAMQTFQSAYPTAVEAVKSQEFNAWIASAPKHVQDAFRNGSTPDEALAVMDAYDAHLRRVGQPSIAAYPTQQQAKPVAAPRPNNTERLKAAAGLPSRASGAKGGMPPEDDFEASLEFFRSQRLRRAAA
jgi:DNA repair exonuclease SbcCD ATPase subunit